MMDSSNLQTFLNSHSIAVIGAPVKRIGGEYHFSKFEAIQFTALFDSSNRKISHGLADIISRTGELVKELGTYFHQIDINPIVFSNDHWITLDAQLNITK